MAIVSHERLKKSDAVVCLEGDGYTRIPQTAEIFKRGLAEWVVSSGGLDRPPFSILGAKLVEVLVKEGVSKEKIILEESSQNTWDQGVEIMKLAEGKGWEKLILVSSPFHQPRVYLTFLQAMKEAGMKIQIFNAPASELPWFEPTALGPRIKLLEDEFRKIDEYQKKGHLVSLEEALKYQEWKEKQP